MANDDLQALLRTGIQAAQAGSHETARTILRRVVEQDPDSELGWIWLVTVADSLPERRECLQQVLRINPDNARAQKALAQLRESEAQQSASSPRVSQRPQSQAGQADRSPEASSRPAFDREALLEPVEPAQERRFSRVLFLMVSILAIVLIAIGSYLVWGEVDDDTGDTGDITAASTRTDAGPAPSASAGAASALQTTPSLTPPVTRGPTSTVPHLPPTWTPSPTATAPPTATPSATPEPLTNYTLLYAGIRGFDFHWSLYRVSADGSDNTRLAASLSVADSEAWRLTDVYEPSLSPDGTQLAVTARFETRVVDELDEEETPPAPTVFQEICLMPVTGGVLDCLTSFGVDGTGAPSWGPDGEQIVFESPADGDYEIYTVTVEDASPIPLTRNDYDDRDPDWSPDGTAIVYASEDGGIGQMEIWRMAPDGSRRAQLTDAANSSFAPSWSPEGERIAFISDRGVDADLYVMDGDGSGERLLTSGDDNVADRDPAWSGDGQWLVFSAKPENGAFNLHVMRPDGSDQQMIVAGSGDSRFAIWLP